MTVLPIIPFAHDLLARALSPGDSAIDCTVGNGHDTLFLATHVGPCGRVFGLDIQGSAIAHTHTRLTDAGIEGRVALTRACHASLGDVIPPGAWADVKAAVFNLGYLPGGDKRICTGADTTIMAIDTLLRRMPVGGVIVLVVYPGHPEGAVEARAIATHVKDIPRNVARVVTYQVENSQNNPPFVIGLEILGVM